MKWTETSDSLCPIAQTSAVLGDRWTLLILREAFLGARQFDDFQSVLGVSPHLLSVRLKRLVEEEIFLHDGGKRSPYRLSEAGRALQPVILLMVKWGNDWRSDGAPQARHVHRHCGGDFEPVVTCSCCKAPVGFDVETVFSAELNHERDQQIARSRQGRRKQKER